jgi:hypothetical protein
VVIIVHLLIQDDPLTWNVAAQNTLTYSTRIPSTSCAVTGGVEKLVGYSWSEGLFVDAVQWGRMSKW